MARHERKSINGIQVTLQSVSPQWYLDNYDRYGRGKNTYKYMDELIRGVVVQPTEIQNKGMQYFDEIDDIRSATALVDEIETFLGGAKKQGNSQKQSAAAQ